MIKKSRVRVSYAHMLVVGMGVGVALKIIAGYPSEVFATTSEAAKTETKTENKAETKQDHKPAGQEEAKPAEGSAAAARAAERCVTGKMLEAADTKLQLLQDRENAVGAKERMIEIAEQRLQEQISRLEATRKKLAETAGLAEEKTSKDREKLILIYEQMKPKEAAAIFNEMDPVVSADLLRSMKEQKSSAVLATMDAKKAYEVTIVLSSYLKKQQADSGFTPAPAAPAPGSKAR